LAELAVYAFTGCKGSKTGTWHRSWRLHDRIGIEMCRSAVQRRSEQVISAVLENDSKESKEARGERTS